MAYRYIDSAFSVEAYDNGFVATFPLVYITVVDGVPLEKSVTLRKVYKNEDHDELLDDIDDFIMSETVEHFMASL